MKKSGLTLLILFFVGTFVHAQFRVAIAGGPSISSVKEDNNLPGWDSTRKNYSSRTGFHIGFIADVRLSPKSKFTIKEENIRPHTIQPERLPAILLPSL